MSSLLCVKSLDGKVEMHNKTVAEDLAVEDDTMPRSFMPMKSAAKRTSKKISKRPMSTPNLQTDNTAPGMDAGYLINNTLKMQDWIGKKQATDLQEKSVMENIGVLQLYSPLLDTEKSLVHDLNEYLEHTDLLELRKRELLHKNWNEKVYEPIRRQILAAMNGQDWTEKDRRRRELHCQYLEHVNRKGHVFLDTMDKGEYYAQALYCHRPAPITVSCSCFYHSGRLLNKSGFSHWSSNELQNLTFMNRVQRGRILLTGAKQKKEEVRGITADENGFRQIGRTAPAIFAEDASAEASDSKCDTSCGYESGLSVGSQKIVSLLRSRSNLTCNISTSYLQTVHPDSLSHPVVRGRKISSNDRIRCRVTKSVSFAVVDLS
ncbi:uncharacterized protein [Littorina saxatilis]|uniref:uncharacterized protein isoform X2 n=1 Tax=Littorina saxatilis TaxID=31220 RepID=UPI0038B6292F